MKLNRNYLIATAFLLLTEVFIALYVRDNFIRPYIGDVLVVILIYCFITSFFNFNYWKTAIGVWVFACFIEWTQYENLIVMLGWEKSGLAKAVLGNSFAWHDIVAYTAGVAAVVLVEWLRNKKNSSQVTLNGNRFNG